ncbi:hypothetical protein ACFVDQ_41930 [Streptomyces sp. NPDC057684]|uniref:hypothetical protein n=1 Tax=unclassified Streptomyces TaxID=2593676 RepID=UPI003680FC50
MSRTGIKGSRSRALAAATAAALLVLPLVGATTAQAQGETSRSAATQAAANVAGTWAVHVHIPGSPDVVTNIHFTPGGIAFAASSGGSGPWIKTSTNHYSYRLAEPMFDANGTYLGRLDVKQNIVVSGDTFTGSGETKVYDVNDTLTATVPVTEDATRA